MQDQRRRIRKTFVYELVRSQPHIAIRHDSLERLNGIPLPGRGVLRIVRKDSQIRRPYGQVFVLGKLAEVCLELGDAVARVERAPVPALCCCSRRTRSVVQPTYVNVLAPVTAPRT